MTSRGESAKLAGKITAIVVGNNKAKATDKNAP